VNNRARQFFSVAAMDTVDRSEPEALFPFKGDAAQGPSAAETIRGDDLLAWRRELLRLGGGAVDLDWLLEMAGGLSWSQLQSVHLHPERSYRLGASLEAIETLWNHHLQTAVPLQYMVGLCPWRDLELEVGPGVLIPRQETELLVELALSLLPAAEHQRPPLVWLDLGTGSGCLAVALARAFPGSSGWAVDCSDLALARAQTNLERYDCHKAVRLLQSHWWQSLDVLQGQLDLIVTNPPYIPTPLLASLDPLVREHEPWLALDGGEDGLDAIRSIVAEAKTYLAPGGLLLMEHHHDQSTAVIDLLVSAGLGQPRAHRDLEGILRFASGTQAAIPGRQPSPPW
jgi:release factor glutamine methyltransferase